MKRIFAGTAAAMLAAVLFFPLHAEAISAEKAILLDGTTGRVLYEHRADERSLIASTTKIMTALVVCEQCNVLDRMRIPGQAVGIEGSSLYLREGEILTIQELLYGMMLHSGNDAAVALAIYCGGTVEGFAEMMNDKARVLGLKNTHFQNPNGLDSPDHYSTARDLAVLTEYAMHNPVFQKTVSARTVTIGSRSLRNHNKLLWRVPGADGVKTGYTKAAGRILVSSAQRAGRRLIGVTIQDPDDWNDHSTLLEKGFAEFRTKQLVTAGEKLGEAEIAGGQSGKAELLAAEDFKYAVAGEEKTSIVLSGPGFVYAPVAQGGNAGYAYICLDGRPVGKIPLLFGSTIEQKKTPEKNFWQKLFRGDRS